MQKINLDQTINSGQVFLWKKLNDTWYGVNGQNILSVNKDLEIFSYKKEKLDFLWMETSLNAVTYNYTSALKKVIYSPEFSASLWNARRTLILREGIKRGIQS